MQKNEMIKPFEIRKIRPFVMDEVQPFIVERREKIAPVKPFTILQDGENEQKNQIASFKTEKEEETLVNTIPPVCNYEIRPLERIVFIDRKGNEKFELETIKAQIKIVGGGTEEINIRTKDIRRIAKIIGDRFAGAIVYETEAKADKVIENEFRKKMQDDVRTVKCYVEAGWQDIDGRRMYVHDAIQPLYGIKIATNVSLPAYQCSSEKLRKLLQVSLNLYREPVTLYTMFLFAFSGVSYRMFMEAGYTPHFLLFLNGKTGSMKTTIAKIFFAQMMPEKHREHVRRIDADTVVSFERAITVGGVDTVTLIDDYAPAKTTKKKAEMADKLEAIIRMVGDGSTKSRSNQNLEDIQGEGVQGTVVLTGEIRGKGLSSNLRCLYCEMVREQVVIENITYMQEQRYGFTTIIANYAEFLALNWEKCVYYIRQKFSQKRKEISKELKEKRLVDAVVFLHIIAEFIQSFIVDYCDYTLQEAKDLGNEMKKSVLENAAYSEEISQEETPALMFVKALNILRAQNKLILARKEDYIRGGKYCGFEDENFVFLEPEAIYEQVLRYLRNINKFFPLDMRETVIALYEEGIIKTYSNGTGKKTYYARIALGKQKYKFIKISKKILQAVEEKDF